MNGVIFCSLPSGANNSCVIDEGAVYNVEIYRALNSRGDPRRVHLVGNHVES